jgi:serine protease Do
VVSFVISLISIPAFGLLTGWISVLLGCIGLVLRQPKQRGLALGALSIVIGIGSSIGWAFFYFQDSPFQAAALSFDEYDIDPASIDSLPPAIARPMRSNVLMKTRTGLAGLDYMIGAGIILKVDADAVLLLTNRHVIDDDFNGSQQEKSPLPDHSVNVQFLGRAPLNGSVVWMAPFGVDAALVRVPTLNTQDLVAACWAAEAACRVSDRVFVVGNPMGLAWSHASGEVSQVRRQDFGPLNVRVIQISAPVNTGNSGGGLYDEHGLLIGVNTWTKDKRFAEGLAFSISFQSILELIPAEFNLPKSRLP